MTKIIEYSGTLQAERSSRKKEEPSGAELTQSPSVTSNGDVTDPTMISVSVVHNNGRTVVDSIEMTSPTGVHTPHSPPANMQTPPPSYFADTHNEDDETNRPLLATNPAYSNKEMRAAALNGGNSSGSEDSQFNTAL